MSGSQLSNVEYFIDSQTESIEASKNSLYENDQDSCENFVARKGMNKNKGHMSQSDEDLVDEETKSCSSETKDLEPVLNIDTQYEYNTTDESSCDSFTTRPPDLDIFQKDVVEWDREDIAALVSWLSKKYSVDLDMNNFPSDGKALLAMKEDIVKLLGTNETSFFKFVSSSPECAYSSKIKKRRPLREKKADSQIPDRWLFKIFLEFLKIPMNVAKWKISSLASLAILVVILAVILFHFGSHLSFSNHLNYSISSSQPFDKKHLQQEILEKYPSQPKQILKSIFSDINEANNTKEENLQNVVITMLYFHQRTAHCLAKDIANYAANIFQKNKQIIELDGLSLNINFTIGCNDFKNSIKKSGILVVYNFHNMSADVVKNFHGVCDTHSSYTKSKAVYIILLGLGPDQQNITKSAGKVNSRMTELWYSLEDYILKPLITRLSDNIIEVKEELSEKSGC